MAKKYRESFACRLSLRLQTGLGTFSLSGSRVGNRWKVVNGLGKVLDQKMDDSLHVDKADRAACIVYNRQTTVAVSGHLPDREGNRVRFADGKRMLNHLRGNRLIKIPSLNQYPNHVSLCENSHESFLAANQQRSTMLFPENKQGLTEGGVRRDTERRKQSGLSHRFLVQLDPAVHLRCRGRGVM